MFSSFSRCHKTCCGDKVYCCDRSDVSRVCHGASVTRHKGAWQCHNLPTLYGTTGPFISLLMGISHNISSPQPLHSSSTLPCHERLNITQPLPIQVKESNGHPTVGVHVLGSMKSQLRHRRHKIVTESPNLSAQVLDQFVCLMTMLSPRPRLWQLTTRLVINEASHKVKMRSFCFWKNSVDTQQHNEGFLERNFKW